MYDGDIMQILDLYLNEHYSNGIDDVNVVVDHVLIDMKIDEN